MNKIINKFMSELHLKQLGFAYSACGQFTKYCEPIQKLRETSNFIYLYRNELGKTCFAHNVAYSNSKDVAKRTILDNVLKEKAYGIVKNPEYDGYQRALTKWSIIFLM